MKKLKPEIKLLFKLISVMNKNIKRIEFYFCFIKFTFKNIQVKMNQEKRN